RQRPCSLCVSRGVPHLCRWEPAPYARSLKSTSASGEPEVKSTIEQLRSRIEALESALKQANANAENHLEETPSLTATPETEESPSTKDVDPVATVAASVGPEDVYDAAMSLAQLSMSNRGEYMGMGSLLCLLYRYGRAGEFPTIRVPYAQSTKICTANLFSPVNPRRRPPISFPDDTRSLIKALPSKAVCDALLGTYFADVNWRFGIPEAYFRQNYNTFWDIIHETDVNPCWLSLLYAMFASVPHVDEDTNQRTTEYFHSAIAARKIAEDDLLRPVLRRNRERCSSAIGVLNAYMSSTDGTVLSCIAAPLLAAFLADRRLVSEGWKLLGASVRSAFAVGLHLDPDWETFRPMDNEERLIRRRAWWSLLVWDRLYSHILGRPAAIEREHFSVVPPWKYNQESAPEPFDVFQSLLIKLSDILATAQRTCLVMSSVTGYSAVLSLDKSFLEWEQELQLAYPSIAAVESSPPLFYPFSSDENANRMAERQHHILMTWYLASRMAIHRHFLSLPSNPHEPTLEAWMSSDAIRDTCISLSKRLIDILISAIGTDDDQESVLQNADGLNSSVKNGSARQHVGMRILPGKISGFHDGYFLFDAAVTLIGSSHQMGTEGPRAADCRAYFERAGAALGSLARRIPGDHQCEIAQKAVAVMLVLKRGEEKMKNRQPRLVQQDPAVVVSDITPMTAPPDLQQFGVETALTAQQAIEDDAQLFMPSSPSQVFDGMMPNPSSFLPPSNGVLPSFWDGAHVFAIAWFSLIDHDIHILRILPSNGQQPDERHVHESAC
ncbi:hypothetical protein FISHEDRAFT_40844, partial [Fistulina hepatica ATCC 64428]